MADAGAIDEQAAVTRAAVEEYFKCVTGRDIDGIGRLFAPGAVLRPADGAPRHGKRAIVGVFGEGFALRLNPRPGIVLVDGERAAVEVELVVDGRARQLLDLFEVDAVGLVTSLRIYESGRQLSGAAPL